jgi:hypothetical protein
MLVVALDWFFWSDSFAFSLWLIALLLQRYSVEQGSMLKLTLLLFQD